MEVRRRLLWGMIGLGLLAGAAAREPQALGPAQALLPGDGRRTPVVVELFTSEGCSSCPPADALLARLEKTQPVPGAEVVALKEHVDYWNHLGWRDPYSSAAFSERQRAYAWSFGNSSVYTPQMIVDGRAEFVGSVDSRAQQAIARAAATPKAAVHLEWAAPQAGGNEVPLRVRIAALREVTPQDTAEVYLAITESGLHSDVARGENAGRQLDHFSVVRELKGIGQANPLASSAFAAEPVVAVAGGWKRENLRAVVFVQEKRSRRMLAAAAIPFSQP